eukprot:scaffold32581_cov124-Isochrysis_galbana.AAC.2
MRPHPAAPLGRRPVRAASPRAEHFCEHVRQRRHLNVGHRKRGAERGEGALLAHAGGAMRAGAPRARPAAPVQFLLRLVERPLDGGTQRERRQLLPQPRHQQVVRRDPFVGLGDAMLEQSHRLIPPRLARAIPCRAPSVRRTDRQTRQRQGRNGRQSPGGGPGGSGLCAARGGLRRCHRLARRRQLEAATYR